MVSPGEIVPEVAYEPPFIEAVPPFDTDHVVGVSYPIGVIVFDVVRVDRFAPPTLLKPKAFGSRSALIPPAISNAREMLSIVLRRVVNLRCCAPVGACIVSYESEQVCAASR